VENQINKLIDHYRKALLIKPNSIAIYNQIAELHYQQGDLEQALENCQQILQNQSDLTLVPKTLDKVLQDLGFEKEEAVSFHQLLQNTSVLAESFITLETILSPSENVKNAADAKTWKEAIALGYSLRQQQRWDEAMPAYFKAIEIEPSLMFPHYVFQYLILPHVSNLEPVINWYYQAIKIPRIHRYSCIVLGDILTKQGQLGEAIACYKQAWLKSNIDDFSENLCDQQRVAVDYLIIGVGKSGTSSLHQYLSQHPQVVNPYKKELHFFNTNFEAGLDWYLAQFPPLCQGKSFLTGEATPWYLGSYDVEKRVFQLFPNIKLVAVLRNPVARAVSQYYMNLKLDREHRSLEAAMTSEMAILKGIADPTEVMENYWKTEKGYLWFGFYVYFIQKWMALFSENQFLFLRSEDLYNAPATTMKQVFDFLELSDYKLPNYPKWNSGSYSRVSDDLRQTLSDFFQPHNQKLEEYLSIKFNWQ